MRIGALAAAFVLLCAWQGSAMAQTSQEERIRKLEQRIRYLENRVGDQDKAIVNKAREAKEEQADKWFSKVEVGGAVELELAHSTDYEGKSSSGLDAATVELGATAQIHDWVSGEVLLAWNGDDEVVEVDTATVTVQQPDAPFSVTGGIMTMAFGTYETNLISDPMTLDIGEVGATGLQIDVEAGGVTASGFVFKGANERGGHDRIANYGFSVGFAFEGDSFELGANAGYINDIAEAGAFQDSEEFDPAEGDAVAGAHASVAAKWGSLSLTGEYVTALKSFKGTELAFRSTEEDDGQGGTEEVPLGAKPSAWSIEAAIGFEVMDSEVTAASSYQATQQAVALGLPESRYLLGVSVGIVEGVGVGAEIAFDKDYSVANGGTGEDATAFTLLFAAEF